MKSAIGKDIKFFRGLSKFNDDLRKIDPKYNNVLIFERFEAIQSPIVPRRHRTTSVILQLQNMFPKGKFNTDISWNAHYMALFRSTSDRKQIGIFDKNAPYLKALQDLYGVAVMYTSARNTFNRYNSTVSFAYENYWPVQIRHYSNGKTNFL